MQEYSQFMSKISYQAPSKTDFGIDPRDIGLKPNVFLDIDVQLK